ncbi:hypothetical protein [Leptospira bandrabouensis]|uniref:hypothetical protein n=1 Tax=Leptospira bandrabouensis TaxID=2484903 RepID=UPI001EE85A18|nr:hypothetical protein [Leptospira bandrabouensis]MCG6146518.1 hypothetical protein [Leptospira bandrabouensis]MCG6161890.1 hypothetical protein [Leptospira bandrabouensis]MCG6166059.1 hypothetical protein [Leptospira bandrabouensis]
MNFKEFETMQKIIISFIQNLLLINKLIVLFFFIVFPAFSQNTKNITRIYIETFKKSNGAKIDQDKIKIIYSQFFKEIQMISSNLKEEEIQILDDEDASKRLKYEQLKRSFSGDDQISLGKVFEYDYVLSGELFQNPTNNNIKLVIKKTNVKTNSRSITAEVEFSDYNQDYYIEEIAKESILEGYKINKRNAPKFEFAMEAMANVDIEEIKLNNRNIIQATRSKDGKFRESINRALNYADDQYTKGNYKTSADYYLTISERSKDLPEEERDKFSQLSRSNAINAFDQYYLEYIKLYKKKVEEETEYSKLKILSDEINEKIRELEEINLELRSRNNFVRIVDHAYLKMGRNTESKAFRYIAENNYLYAVDAFNNSIKEYSKINQITLKKENQNRVTKKIIWAQNLQRITVLNRLSIAKSIIDDSVSTYLFEEELSLKDAKNGNFKESSVRQDIMKVSKKEAEEVFGNLDFDKEYIRNSGNADLMTNYNYIVSEMSKIDPKYQEKFLSQSSSKSLDNKNRKNYLQDQFINHRRSIYFVLGATALLNLVNNYANYLDAKNEYRKVDADYTSLLSYVAITNADPNILSLYQLNVYNKGEKYEQASGQVANSFTLIGGILGIYFLDLFFFKKSPLAMGEDENQEFGFNKKKGVIYDFSVRNTQVNIPNKTNFENYFEVKYAISY